MGKGKQNKRPWRLLHQPSDQTLDCFTPPTDDFLGFLNEHKDNFVLYSAVLNLQKRKTESRLRNKGKELQPFSYLEQNIISSIEHVL